MIPPTEQEMQMAQMAIDADQKTQKTQTSKPKSEVEPDVDTDKVEGSRISQRWRDINKT